MIVMSINVSRVDKSALYEGKNGKYLSLTLHENKNGTDKFGNHGFVSQDLGKERRMKGEKGPILGNYKHVGGYLPQAGGNATSADKFTDEDPNDEIPF